MMTLDIRKNPSTGKYLLVEFPDNESENRRTVVRVQTVDTAFKVGSLLIDETGNYRWHPDWTLYGELRDRFRTVA